MGLPTSEARIRDAERELSRDLPEGLRRRLLRENGGSISVEGYPGDDPEWRLHPVLDPGDRTRASRSANHIVRETQEARTHATLPSDAVVIAENGTGDLLLLLPDDERPYWWDHETTAVHPVATDWS